MMERERERSIRLDFLSHNLDRYLDRTLEKKRSYRRGEGEGAR